MNPIPFQGGYGYPMENSFPFVNPNPFPATIHNYARELIKEDELESKITGLRSRKTAQISKSDEIDGYYECIVISNDEVPLLDDNRPSGSRQSQMILV